MNSHAQRIAALSFFGLAALVVSAMALMVGSVDAHAAAGKRGCKQPIPDIFEAIAPSVVTVTALSINPYSLTERVNHRAGSGFIVDPAGLIVTNAHVVMRAQSVTVFLQDDTALPAKILGLDPIFDVALLRVDPPQALPAVRLGDSERLRVGEDVIAIGNPLGLEETLTRGVVSAVNRVLPAMPLIFSEPFIQTDAPINPGNSGGPLVNRCGEVVGVNTAILEEAQNIGFAIPIDVVKAILPTLLAHGRVIRPWLGFHGQFIGAELQKFLRAPLAVGFLIEAIEPGSPAERAGLQAGTFELVIDGRSLLLGGDIITAVNGVGIDSPEAWVAVIAPLKVGSKLRLTVFRAGEQRQVDYELPERPMLPGDFAEKPALAPATDPPPQRPSIRMPSLGVQGTQR
jgi:serine protease Do